MKRCPTCDLVETDDALRFCRADGTTLISYSGSLDAEAGTVKFDSGQMSGEIETSILPHASTAPEIHRSTGPTTVLPAPQTQNTTRELTKPKRRGVVLASIGLIVIVIAVAGYFYLSRNHTTAIESIAVMPFINDSGNADVEYLSDGMTETLISSLSQLPNLNVKPRSSVFRYKGKETNPQTIGKELKVQAILNGRVVQRGQDLSLFVELIDVALDKVVWSEQYNRKQTDLVSLQSEVARDVSNKLKTKLSGAEVAKVEKTYTASSEAYQLYLKGRFQWNKRTSVSLKQAVAFFDQAIAKDPNYALAYSGLAETYVLFPNLSVALPQESMPKAKAAAVRAIELDDSLAEAHVALGLYLSLFSWNQSAAEREFRRAIELNPNYPTAHQQFASSCLLAMGKLDEAIAEGRRAEELDPLSPIISADSGWNLFFARRYDEAIIQLKRALTIDPNFYITHRYLGTVYHTKGMYEAAVAEYRKALALNDDPFVRAMLARSLAKSGQSGEAIKILAELESESALHYVPSNGIASAFAALGEKDKAFIWLEKDVAQRASRPPQYAVNPVWDDLRDDPRFADLVRRIGLATMD